MLDHLQCRCGHAKMVHSLLWHSECRICARNWGVGGINACYEFRWRWSPRAILERSKTGQRAG